MLRTTSRLLGAAAIVTAAVVVFTASPALAATVDAGHIDALDVDYDGSTVTLDIKTYNPPNADDDDVPAAGTLVQFHPLADYDLVVTSGSGSWPCIGAVNDTVYVAPSGVTGADPRIWPGWNILDVPTGNRPVTIELVSVSGPGHLTLYNMVGFPAAPSVVLSNSSATGCADPSHSIGTGSAHGHANWAFSEPGDYDVTFKATVTGGATSGNVLYHFKVGA